MKLFPRKHGCAKSVATRLKATAHTVLDRARLGDSDAQQHIDWALRVTGDLVGGGGAHVGACPPAFGPEVSA